MITWQFWTLIVVFIGVCLNLSAALDKIELQLGFITVTLNDLTKSSGEAPGDVPLPAPLPSES